MNMEQMENAWRSASSPRIQIDLDVLVKQVQRNDASFRAMIFWRDVREFVAGAALLGWVGYDLARGKMPAAGYLIVLGVLWVMGYLVWSRLRRRPTRSHPGEPLASFVDHSLAEVEHQIWLLKNVLWWYLLPLALPIMAVMLQVMWRSPARGPLVWAVWGIIVLLMLLVFWAVARLNQWAIRAELEPRRDELKSVRDSLKAPTGPPPGTD